MCCSQFIVQGRMCTSLYILRHVIHLYYYERCARLLVSCVCIRGLGFSLFKILLQGRFDALSRSRIRRTKMPLNSKLAESQRKCLALLGTFSEVHHCRGSYKCLVITAIQNWILCGSAHAGHLQQRNKDLDWFKNFHERTTAARETKSFHHFVHYYDIIWKLFFSNNMSGCEKVHYAGILFFYLAGNVTQWFVTK